MSSLEQSVVGLTAFHIDTNDPRRLDEREEINKLRATVGDLRSTTSSVVVVDNGAHLSEQVGDVIVSIPINLGKAEAIRRGFSTILSSYLSPAFIIQTDSDRDINPRDTELMLNFFRDHGITADQPVMVIGDRYLQDESGILPPHRRALLKIQGAFCHSLGYQVRDCESGLRAYTTEYVREFMELSCSCRYGIETEQMVIANLIGAQVDSVPLTYSRPRDPQTLTSKLLQSVDAILGHSVALNAKGLNSLVDFFEQMRLNMGNKFDFFTLNLDQLNSDGVVKFQRIGDSYTLICGI